LEESDPEDCFICRGLFARVDRYSAKAARAAKRYQFKTFAVGIVMPEGVQEREDELRSSLKMKGGESVKVELARVTGKQVARLTGKRQDKSKPDLSIVVDLQDSGVKTAARPVFYHARYTKPRGVSQRREFCPDCGGKGCGACGGTGFDHSPSVEDALRKKILKEGEKAVFTWIGSEDRESLVLPPGRPFVVEVKNPHARKIASRFACKTSAGTVRVSGGRVLRAQPTALPKFRFRTRILAEASERVADDELSELAKRLRGAEVRFDRPRHRSVTKKVYSVKAESRGKRLTIDAELDGGLPVKRFVSGELVSPSVSEVLKKEVRCRRFDIHRVTETGGFQFG